MFALDGSAYFTSRRCVFSKTNTASAGTRRTRGVIHVHGNSSFSRVLGSIFHRSQSSPGVKKVAALLDGTSMLIPITCSATRQK